MTRQMLRLSSFSSSNQSSENGDMIDPPNISINEFDNLDGKDIDLNTR